MSEAFESWAWALFGLLVAAALFGFLYLMIEFMVAERGCLIGGVLRRPAISWKIR